MVDEYDAPSLISIIQSLIFVGWLFFAWFNRKQTAKATELEKLKEDVNTLKEQVKHLPDCHQISKIEADIQGMNMQLQAMNNTLQLLHKHILNSGK